MKRREFQIVFEPAGRRVFALPGTPLFEAAARAGLLLQSPCGGGGRCGKCRVRVVAGACPPTPACRAALGPAAIGAGWRLACQARLHGDLVVDVPAAALYETAQQILVRADDAPAALRPAVAKRCADFGTPTAADARADLERVRHALRPLDCPEIGLDLLRRLPGLLRQSAFRATATVADGELIDLEPGDTSGACFGVAVDLGTTTVVGVLVNLATGAEAAVEAMLNPQAAFGDDVISRIRLCRDDPGGLAQVQGVILGALNTLVEALVRSAGVDRRQLYEIVLAGNTAMQQIACGLSPAALGEVPFVPVFRDALFLRAADLGLAIHPGGRIYVFPQIGGFVGGDTVAGILASRLDRESGSALLVDIGTNGELVLAHDGVLTAASVAAGPAFEGARMSCGMRATAGAIEKLVIARDLRMNVIGNARPAGLCGSGLIDAVAELLRAGLLDPSGRLRAPDELPAGLPAPLRHRVLARGGRVEFLLAPAAETASGQPLVLTQRDIRELQLANAAMRAGIRILLARRGLQAGDLDRVLLAGAFGNFIRRNQARRIGLLPPVATDRIRCIGNASLMGAKQALRSVDEKAAAAAAAIAAHHVDLSLAPEFQEAFSEAMLFPDADPDPAAESAGRWSDPRQARAE